MDGPREDERSEWSGEKRQIFKTNMKLRESNARAERPDERGGDAARIDRAASQMNCCGSIHPAGQIRTMQSCFAFTDHTTGNDIIGSA